MKTAEQWQLGEIAHGGIELALVRRIQIDALREARDIIERNPSWGGNNPALPELDKCILKLEFK